MDTFLSIFDFISGLGVSVLMPIIIWILGMILGVGCWKEPSSRIDSRYRFYRFEFSYWASCQ